jgi:hypothetical protein
MVNNNGTKPPKKSWEELVTAASLETDQEKVASIAEEIFAALEERERTGAAPRGPQSQLAEP